MLVLVMAILLATGAGSAVAAQITSVFVTNDAAHPVAVHEQVPNTVLSDQELDHTNTTSDIDTENAKEIRILAIGLNGSGISGMTVFGKDAQGNPIGLITGGGAGYSLVFDLPPPKIQVTVDGGGGVNGFFARVVVLARNN